MKRKYTTPTIQVMPVSTTSLMTMPSKWEAVEPGSGGSGSDGGDVITPGTGELPGWGEAD